MDNKQETITLVKRGDCYVTPEDAVESFVDTLDRYVALKPKAVLKPNEVLKLNEKEVRLSIVPRR